jgi:ssRNA-specific RNase YbeY (16S rRNA maturation enzyme)
MSNGPLVFVALISLVGVANAQGKFGDVTTSADPAKAAMVEKQAAELKAARMHQMSHGMRHHVSHMAGHRHSQIKSSNKG